MAARRGHFRLESGHHGDLWLDLDGLFWSPSTVAPPADRLAELLAARTVDVVCGPLGGGALPGRLVAARLGVAFVHAERTTTGDGLYAAEYRVPLAPAGTRVVIVDDVVHAGSAARATARAPTVAGATPVGIAARLVPGERAGRGRGTWASRSPRSRRGRTRSGSPRRARCAAPVGP